MEYFETTDFWNKDDDEAWCSAFVHWGIVNAGLKGTDSARARSWHEDNWGQALDEPREGGVAVL